MWRDVPLVSRPSVGRWTLGSVVKFNSLLLYCSNSHFNTSTLHPESRRARDGPTRTGGPSRSELTGCRRSAYCNLLPLAWAGKNRFRGFFEQGGSGQLQRRRHVSLSAHSKTILGLPWWPRSCLAPGLRLKIAIYDFKRIQSSKECDLK
jgi:hypothetical protein